MSQELMGARAAAAYLGVSKPRLYVLTKEGRIGRKVAGYWVYTPAELDAYKRERAERPKGGRPKEESPVLAQPGSTHQRRVAF